MQFFEVNFRPARRRVRGVRQPDVSYQLAAQTAADATAYARSLINGEHPGYLHTKTRPLAVENA